MDERINEGASLSLVIREKSLREKLALSGQQEKLLSEITIKYLRDNRFDFKRANFNAAALVVGDCLLRGLLLSGKTEIGVKDNLRALVSRGLENREQIKVSAKDAVRFIKDPHYVEDCPFIGPFAFRIKTVNDAMTQLRHFALTADINHCQELAYDFQQRCEFLDKCATFALSTLPRDKFPKSDIENFPSFEEKAKIVRNMITAYALRGDFLPVIWIEELRELVTNGDELKRRFNREFLEKTIQFLSDGTGFNQDDLTLLIGGLFAQARQRFLSAKIPSGVIVSEHELIQSRDVFYRQFNDVLLLLHPALEEPEIAVSAEGAKGTEYSIWREDLSVVFDGKTVPTRLGLMRAQRLVAAKGFDEVRFKNGINVWTEYEKSLSRERTRIARLEAELAELARQQIELRSPDNKLPPEAYSIAVYSSGLYFREFNYVKKRFGQIRSIINGAIRERSEAENYVNELVLRNGGVLPDRDIIPEIIYTKIVERLIGRRDNITKIARSNIADANGEIEEDFLGKYSLFECKGIDWEKADQQLISREIERLMNVKAQVNEGSVPLAININSIAGYINDQLRLLEIKREIGGLTKKDGLKKGELLTLRSILPRVEAGFVKKPSYIRSFARWSLSRRISQLERISKAKDRIDYARAIDVNLPKEWKREQILEYLNTVRCATLPMDVDWFDVERVGELSSQTKEIAKWVSTSYDSRFAIAPAVIGTRAQYKDWVTSELKNIWQKVSPLRSGGDARQARRRSRYLDQFKMYIGLLKLANNPLLPLEEAKGFKRDVFWSAFTRRRRLAEAICDYGETEKLYGIAEDRFTQVARYLYVEHLKRKAKSASLELERLQAGPGRARFLQKMGGLGFILEEPDEVDKPVLE